MTGKVVHRVDSYGIGSPETRRALYGKYYTDIDNGIKYQQISRPSGNKWVIRGTTGLQDLINSTNIAIQNINNILNDLEIAVLSTTLTGGDYTTLGNIADGISILTAFGYTEARITNLESLYASLPSTLATLNDDTASIDYTYNAFTQHSSWNLVNVGTASTKGTASKSATVATNSKGQVSALSDQDIAITESQVTNLVTDLAAKEPIELTATVSTTNGVATTILTTAIAAATNVSIRGIVEAIRTGGSAGSSGDRATYSFVVTFKNVSGTVTAISNVISLEDQTGWALTFAGSGTNGVVQVAGATNNNVNWKIYYKIYSLT